MKDDPVKCDSGLLGRLFDGELDPEAHTRVTRHLKDCPLCQKDLRKNEAISSFLKGGLDEQLSGIDLGNLEQGVLELIRRKKGPWWVRLKELLLSKRFLIPATAVAAMLLLFFPLTRDPATGPGPSAIINSFGGEVSSVMILETPTSHQTVIWFTEAI